jgi:hypothetical protein
MVTERFEWWLREIETVTKRELMVGARETAKET